MKLLSETIRNTLNDALQIDQRHLLLCAETFAERGELTQEQSRIIAEIVARRGIRPSALDALVEWCREGRGDESLVAALIATTHPGFPGEKIAAIVASSPAL